MKIKIVAAAVLLATLPQSEGRTQEMSYGQAEYLNSCAVCHGRTARAMVRWWTS